jgi:hypothetical protein
MSQTKLYKILQKEDIEQKYLHEITMELFEICVHKAIINKMCKGNQNVNTPTIIKLTEALNYIVGKYKYSPNDLIDGNWTISKKTNYKYED